MNLTALRANKDRVWAWIFGISIILLAFDSTRNTIQSYFYYIGIILSVISVVIILADKQYRQRITLGSKFIFIPLIIICASIAISGFFQNNFQTAYSTLFVGIFYFGAYLIARILGKEIFRPFYFFVIIESLSLIITALVLHTQNGGVLSIKNYNIPIGLLLLGSLLAADNHKWIIVTIGSIGMFFTGSEEAIIVFAVLLITIIIRRDFSKKLLVTASAVIVLAVIGMVGLRYTESLYAMPLDKAYHLIFGQPSVLASEYPVDSPSKFDNQFDYYLHGRLDLTQKGLNDIRPFGHGYGMLVGFEVPHNIPIIIIYQVGFVAAIAWVFLMFYGLLKTKWKYLFIGILAASIADHFFWTQLGIYIFVAIGVISVTQIKNDYIYKEAQ